MPGTRDVYHLQNLILTEVGASLANLSQSMSITGDLSVSGTITCTSLTQTSDESVKAAIEDMDGTTAQSVLDGCSARTFVRTDLGEQETKVSRRIGFVAQELMACCPREWINIVHEEGGLLGVSYDRLCCVLWTCLKKTNEQVAQLETRVAALENKKTKKAAV